MTGTLLLPPLLTASVLLVVSGALKLRAPGVATVALAELGVPAARLLVVSGAVVELVVGALVVVWPGVGAPAAGVLFLCFATLVAVQLRKRAGSSCGCFGSAATAPASRLHVLVNLVFAAVCAAAGASDPQPLNALLRPATGVPVYVAAAVTAWALAAGLDLVPRMLTAYRKPVG